ncbi:MAG: TIGR04211 family SH3 domain-containing protein [Desulfobacteraceae bacterium]|nr:TIGR04211 family SH3 domain-containing protein [Desulfobacteraceae bacterium]
MNKIIKYLTITLFSVTFFLSVGYAESVYVSDIKKITMRIAPGAEHKIMRMLESGSNLKVLEKSEAWSKVRTKDGKEGWALTRFLVAQKPAVVLVKELKIKNEKLVKKVASLKVENDSIITANKRLAGIEEKYIELEKESKNFLELKTKYNENLKKFEDQQVKITAFENNRKSKIMTWFLIGAGVFVFGVMLGMGAKKNRRSYLG